MSAREVIDLGTPEGVVEHVKSLPTDNLREIAARPLDQFNYLIVVAAGLELIVRGEG